MLALNGSAIDSVATFLSTMKSFQPGDRVTCRVQRDGKEVNIRRERRRVASTLRSLLTRPIGARKLPAILFVQGFDCSSIEWLSSEPNLTRELIYRLT